MSTLAIHAALGSSCAGGERIGAYEVIVQVQRRVIPTEWMWGVHPRRHRGFGLLLERVRDGGIAVAVHVGEAIVRVVSIRCRRGGSAGCASFLGHREPITGVNVLKELSDSSKLRVVIYGLSAA